MTRTAISTTNAPTPAGAYSQGILADGFLFTAGFGPQDPKSGAIADGIEAQTRQVLDNIEAVLREVGASLDDVVKSTTHLQELKRDFAGYDRVYRERFGEPYPVRTTVGSQLYDILVEIDVIVRVPDSRSPSS